MSVHCGHLYGALSRVEQFTGQQEIRSWIEKFELACEMDGVKSSNEKTSMLKVLLNNEIFRAVNEQGFGMNTDYDVIKNYLIDNFGECESTYLAHNRFISAYQEPSENCRVFGLRLRALAKKAFPSLDSSFLDQHLCNQFIRGCHDRDVKRHLFLSKLTKFEDLVNAAGLIECTLNDERGGPAYTSGRLPGGYNTRLRSENRNILEKTNQFNSEVVSQPQNDNTKALNDIQVILQSIQNRLDTLEDKMDDDSGQVVFDDKKKAGKAQYQNKKK